MFDLLSRSTTLRAALFLLAPLSLSQSLSLRAGAQASPTLTGQAAFTDAAHESPGTRRKVTAADLPEPIPSESVDNGAHVVPRPEGVWPKAPQGFKVELYATGFDNPRLIRTAPNGDIFLAESQTNKIKVLRGVGSDGKVKQVTEFATGLNLPFGIRFYPEGPNPKWIYVGNTDGVVRFPYKNGDTIASGPSQHLLDLPAVAVCVAVAIGHATWPSPKMARNSSCQSVLTRT